MKKLIALLLLSSLLFFGCVAPPPEYNQTIPNHTNYTNLTPPSNATLPANDTNVTKSTPDYCFSLESPEPCLSDFEASDCRLTKHELQCILFFAKNDILLCQLLPEEMRLECQMEYYGCSNDVCMAVSTKNSSYCTTDSCIIEYVSVTGEDVCNFEQVSKQTACKSLIKEDLCKHLVGAVKDECYYYAAIFQDYQGFCYMIKSDSYALPCIKYFAVKNNKPELCEHFSLDTRWACIINYSIESGDFACLMIDQRAKVNRFNCIYYFAKKYSRPDVCIYLDVSVRDTCYSNAIFQEGPLEVSHCSAMVEQGWKEKCYSYAAYRNKDPSLCNLVSSSEKQNCEKRLQQ
ncbi:MAG: hypothetical protein QW035_04435 [Candidatus Anstonellales archaeon]